ncbi:hypothetical protein [Thalassotalea marina]|uniref:Uncharacterized protein n=1 Tax=Thalassotalea marina TaxID=1673741 RepID=A0A919BPB6_9GAMM|nr:hypothetical protein [Thalassotalea marina]GHG04336.1 hypothetical protein GCM10017161_37340 [Thalassotalea marina]
MANFIKQLIESKPTETAKAPKKDCNYPDNYYGDQLCKKSEEQ